LSVVAAQNGRWISLQANGVVPALHGLDQVRGLRVSKVSALDLVEVVDTSPTSNTCTCSAPPAA